MGTSLSTESLIERLVEDVRPIRRLFNPSQRAALWVAVALVSIALGLVRFGIRRDIADAVYNAGFLLRIGLLASTLWLGVVTAFRLAVPGYDSRAFARWWPLVALGALVGVTAAEVAATAMVGELGSPLRSWLCIRKVTFAGAIPALLSVFLIQRASTIEPFWTGLLGLMAAGAAGALTAEIACPIRAPLHIMLWHILPVVATTGLGVLVGSLLLSRLRR